MTDDRYDVIVLGGGAAGENAADYAAQNGLSAVVVESELVGGECSYWACMPSKALLRPGEVLAAARRVKGAREAVQGGPDAEAALELRTAFTSDWSDDGQVSWLESAGVDLVRGRGRLSGERTVTVTDDDGRRELVAEVGVVVATGTRATMPPIDGLEEVDVWDNRHATSAKEVPRRLLVVGGGVVGVELGQAWRRLGAEEVTIVEMTDGLLPPEEPFAGRELRTALEEEGITVMTGSALTGVSQSDGDGPITGRLEDGSEVTADELLMAVGRTPRTGDLGLESVGLEPGDYITVDDHLRATGVDGDWLYAVGDVNGRALLTHHGKYQARLVGDRLGGRDTPAAWADEHAQVRVVFTDPQIAAAGLTAAQAEDRYDTVTTVSHDVGEVAGGALQGEGVGGTAQLVIDEDRSVIVGATFVGPGVGELLHAATVAIAGEVPLDRLWHAVPAFPTVSEVWLRLLEARRDV